MNEKLLHVVPGCHHVNFAELLTNPLKQLDWDNYTHESNKKQRTQWNWGLVTGVLPTTDEDDERNNSDEDSSDEENEV